MTYKEILSLKNIKTILVIIIVAGLLYYIYDIKTSINLQKAKIETLHKSNDSIRMCNENIVKQNLILDSTINILNKSMVENDMKLKDNYATIKRLQNKRNETYKYITTLDAYGISNGFTDYLKKRSKGNNK